VRRLLESTLLWTCALVVAVSAAIAGLVPLDVLKGGQFVGQAVRFDRTGEKLCRYFANGKSSDVLLIGSSLFLYPAIRTDEAMDDCPARYDESYVINNISNYSSARYFEKLLSAQAERPISVVNLCTAGSVMSDQFHVFRKVCATGRKPALLICDVSPREFFDPSLSDPAKTPVYRAIADWSCLSDLFDTTQTAESVGQSLIGSVWNLYRERAFWRDLFVNSTAWLTGHAVDLQSACQTDFSKQKGSKSWDRYRRALLADGKVSPPIYEQPATWAGDLKHYRFMYSPIKESQVNMQFLYLERLLATAQREKVKVCLVQMPLSRANLQLLPQSVPEGINLKAKNLAKKYGAKFLLPDSDVKFTDSDFEDSAHLNAEGGRKLFKTLSMEAADIQL